jgi:arylsulfatase A
MKRVRHHRLWVSTVLQCIAGMARCWADPPNVILIFTDDQGYADVGCYGAEEFKTPHLDRMAREGARFTDFYAANSICTPSRASLLTGRYATRCGVPEVLGPGAEKFLPGHPMGLPQSEITIAELLKQAGYATACIGKWHLGHEPRYLPTRQGFDYYFGLPYSNGMSIDTNAPLSDAITLNRGATIEGIRAGRYDKSVTNTSKKKTNNHAEFYMPLMINEEVVEFPVNQETLSRRYTDETIRFIDQNREAPFFVYLAHTMPHVPLAASREFRDGKELASYADTIEELDFHVGRLLARLKRIGEAENTLVIFTSDNGPWGQLGAFGGSARPLRGFKFHTHEGGQRVPMIAYWPGAISAGTTVSQVASALDILPTLAQLAGVALPDGRQIDGRDIFPLLQGKTDAVFDERPFYYIRGWEVQAVRTGKWKLQEATIEHPFRMKKSKDHPGFLYDLAADPGETEDVVGTYPEVFERLKGLIREADKEIGSGMRRHHLGQ